jgi:hypothetical protein
VVLETADQNPLTQPEIVAAGKVDGTDPLAALRELEQPTVDDLVEVLMAWAQTTFGADEIVRAREEFFSLAGKVFHDDPFYETRINYFFDFFLMERPVLSGRAVEGLGPVTPLGLFLRRCDLGEIHVPAAALAGFQRLARFKHGLFQVLKVRDHTMTVRDLCTREKYQVVAKSDETYRGFEKKDVFQGFLFTQADLAFLSQGIVQHPVKAARVIKKRLKAALKAGAFELQSMLSKLARQQLRYLRHRHVDPVLLYQTEPR